MLKISDKMAGMGMVTATDKPKHLYSIQAFVEKISWQEEKSCNMFPCRIKRLQKPCFLFASNKTCYDSPRSNWPGVEGLNFSLKLSFFIFLPVTVSMLHIEKWN